MELEKIKNGFIVFCDCGLVHKIFKEGEEIKFETKYIKKKEDTKKKDKTEDIEIKEPEKSKDFWFD